MRTLKAFYAGETVTTADSDDQGSRRSKEMMIDEWHGIYTYGCNDRDGCFWEAFSRLTTLGVEEKTGS